MKVIIWHNKGCSTSRKILDFLESQGGEVEIREYLKNPPSVQEINDTLNKMGEDATFILRKKDKVFKEKFAESNFSKDEWIKTMSKNPSIIERPIVITDSKAYLGRPVDEFKEAWG